MNLCGLIFIVAIPMIALSHGYAPLFFGRLLEGISAGLIGVVIPLYLAECLSASVRGKGAAVFQWLPTTSMLFAALISIYFSYHVLAVAKTSDAATLFAYKDHAWRNLFWVALPPGILFILCSLMVSESPRWLFKRGKKSRPMRPCCAPALPSRPPASCRRWRSLAKKPPPSAPLARKSRSRCSAESSGALRACLPGALLHPDYRHQFDHRI